VVFELWVVENRPSPLLWPMAYTTACTTVQAVITSANNADVMWSFSVILLFVLSFCKQDNWRTRKRTSSRRPNLAGTGKRWPSRSGWLLVMIRICAWIPVFHFLRHWGIGHFPTFVNLAILCFLSSHAINSRFEPNLAKWMTPTNVSTILERIFDGHPDPD